MILDESYSFFNPKFGLTYNLNLDSSLYFSYSRANREPSRSDYENNLNVKNTFSFPDHHNYSKSDFEKITTNNSTKIVTTEKDYHRMSDEQKKICGQ